MQFILSKISALLLIVASLSGVCHAQTYAITASYFSGRDQIDDRASAVCIGNSPGGRSLLLTVKHAVSEQNVRVWISADGEWIPVTRILRHPTADLAALECDRQLPGVLFSDSTPIGETVTVTGYGPTYAHTTDGFRFVGRIEEQKILRGDDGSHAMPGDSGGPVLCQTHKGLSLVGIVSKHEGDRPARSRKTYASTRARTGFVPAETISSFVQTQYGCQNGLCPIQIRPQVVQPVGPLGFPRGPARVIRIAEPVPPTYIPVRPPQRDPAPPAPTTGYTGPMGPQGRDGRSVTPDQVETIVNAWLDNNLERLRGEPGPQGPPGPAGTTANSADLTRVNQRLTDIERRPFRMVISSDGTVIDDESYAPGEPVVLDLKRLRSVSGGN